MSMTGTGGSVGQAGIQQVYAGAGKKAKVVKQAGRFKCQDCGTHYVQMGDAADHESSTGHTVPELWDKSPEAAQRVQNTLFSNRSKSDRVNGRVGNGTQGQPGLTSL